MADPCMTPVARMDKMREQRDTLKSVLWEVAERVGFRKGEVPNRGQLLARIDERLKPYNDKHGPLAAHKPAPYVPSHPAYSPDRAPPRPPRPPNPPNPPAPKPKTKPVVEFDITAQRFGACMYNEAWHKLQKRFPPSVDLKAGTHFLGDRNVAYRIVGYLPSKPAFGVAVCPAWMLEDPNYTFKAGDLSTYRTEWVLKKLGGKGATRALEEQRVKQNAARYGVFPEALSKSGFKLDLAGRMRTVRVVDINVHQHDRPIIVEEVVEHNPHLNPNGSRWNISTNRLNEARPNTLSFASAGPVRLKREREAPPEGSSDVATPPPKAPKQLQGSVGDVETVDAFGDDGES